MKISYFFILVSILISCATAKLDIEPGYRFKTETGFSFHFPVSGKWVLGPQAKGQITAGQIFIDEKRVNDGSTSVAIAMHGPILTPKGKSMTNRQMLEQFRKDIEDDAKDGRVKKIESFFGQTKYKDADCLSVTQKGEDQTERGPMTLMLDGRVCLHPSKPYTFIWLSISERRPAGSAIGPTFSKQKNEFFESLEFAP